MKKEKVTRADLRGMRVGQTEVFTLPEPNLLESARTTAAQMKTYGMQFSTSIKASEGSIIITRCK